MTAALAPTPGIGNLGLDLNKLEEVIRQSLSGAGAAGGVSAASPSGANEFAASILAGLRDTAMSDPRLVSLAPKTSPKDLTFIDPSDLAMKGWISSVLDGIRKYGPLVIEALNKDYKPQTPSIAEVVKTVPQQYVQDKSWVDFVTHTLVTLGPAVLDAMRGTKDFTDPANVPTISVPPEAQDKGWFSSALNVVRTALPYVVAAASVL